MARSQKNVEKQTQTLGLGLWKKKLKNVKNEKHTLQDLEYGEKTKTWTTRNGHCRTVATKLTNEENEKLTWQDLEYGEKH